MPFSSVSLAGYYGPEWRDFSITGLDSFAALERAARAEGYGDVAVAAAKRAAALGCTDAEIEQEADVVQEREDWRAERGGRDEPVAWAARLLEEGVLKAIIDAPEGPHDLAQWRPCLEPEGWDEVTVAHLFALLDLVPGFAAERDSAQCAIFYAWAYFFCDGPHAPGLERPRRWTRGRVAILPVEVVRGRTELEPTAHTKATFGRFKRLRDSYVADVQKARRRRDQCARRGSAAGAERAEAAVRELERGTLVRVTPGDLRPEPERAQMLKRKREGAWQGPFSRRYTPGLGVGQEEERHEHLDYDLVVCACPLSRRDMHLTLIPCCDCGWGQTQSPRSLEQAEEAGGGSMFIGPPVHYPSRRFAGGCFEESACAECGRKEPLGDLNGGVCWLCSWCRRGLCL